MYAYVLCGCSEYFQVKISQLFRNQRLFHQASHTDIFFALYLIAAGAVIAGLLLSLNSSSIQSMRENILQLMCKITKKKKKRF